MSSLFSSKHNLCKHKDSCVLNTLKQALVALKYGVYIEVIINLAKLLMALLKKKGMPAVRSILVANLSKVEIPLFFFLFTLCLKGSYCLLRKLRNKEDGWNPFVAGSVAALLSMKFLNKKHWYLVLSLISARVVDCLHNVACEKGYLNPERKNLHTYLMFTFSNYINSYGYFVQPDILGNDIFNLWERMSNLTWREKDWIKSSYLETQRNLVASGATFYDDILQRRINSLT